MAFRLIDTSWKPTASIGPDGAQFALRPPLTGKSDFADISSWSLPTHLAALAMVVMAHILTLWLIISLRTPLPAAVGVKALTITHIANDVPEPLPSPPTITNAPLPVLPPAAQAPPPEWTIARIAASQQMISAPANPPITAPQAQSSPLQPSSRPSGGEIYDPYAGVAPLRRSDSSLNGVPTPIETRGSIAQSATSLPSAAPLGRATEARLAESIARRLPDARGAASIRLTLTPSGQVIRAEIGQSTMSDQARLFLIADARRLRFPPGTAKVLSGSITLPIASG